MSFKKRMNKTLALGLAIGGVYISTHTIYAMNKVDINTEMVKSDNKIELNIDEEEIETEKREIVTTGVLNVREEASKDSDKIATLTEGMVVTVLETKGDWDKIQFSDEKEGWVSSEFTANEEAIVNTTELNLRKGPSTEDEKIELLKRDTQLEVTGVIEVENKEEETTEMWYEVKVLEEDSKEDESNEKKDSDEDKEEITGFVFSELVLTESEEAKLKEEEAKRKAEAEQKSREEANTQEESKSVVSSATSNNSSNSDKKEPVKEESTSAMAGTTITVNASAYSGHTITATGTTPKWGTIAVDPTVIPYGTKVYIPMFDKVFIAEDCGGAIKGNKIDIFMNSSDETRNFGRRNIEIKILG